MLQRQGRLPEGGFWACAKPCSFSGRHRLAAGGVCMANFPCDRRYRVPSSLPGSIVEAVDEENLYEPPTPICPVQRLCPARRLQVLVEKILRSMFAQG